MNLQEHKKRLKDHTEDLAIGFPDGTVICDGCSNRINADDAETMTGYVSTPRGRNSPWHLLKVYCDECNNREINTPTLGIGEAMIEFKPEVKLSKPVVTEVEVIYFSWMDDGVPY